MNESTTRLHQNLRIQLYVLRYTILSLSRTRKCTLYQKRIAKTFYNNVLRYTFTFYVTFYEFVK